MLKKASSFLLILLSGFLLGISWYTVTWTLFLALVPLFIAVNKIHTSDTRKKSLKIWGISYLTFFIWNIVSTWWVYNASLEGAIMAIVLNALLSSWMFLIWYKTEKRIFGSLKFWLLIPIWIAYEWLHHYWEFTWPWLTLGNCFAGSHRFIQWYEFTGVSGGSLWVLVANILFYQVISRGEKNWKAYTKPVLVIIIPIILSYIILGVRTITSEKKINVSIIQPNYDPYTEKFSFGFDWQLDQLHKNLTSAKLNTNTELVVLPETFIVPLSNQHSDVPEANFSHSSEVVGLMNLMKYHFPKAAILTGACTYHEYMRGEKKSSTARKFSDADDYYDSYNTGVYIDTLKNITLYHKSKLVPGVERMPYPGFFKYFEKYAIALGGTMGSLGTQDERTVFEDKVLNIKLAPSICYESIYGNFMSEYISKGAQVICVITNDGWWGNTPGHKQHLSYSRLRAIESRKQVIRSANTGISCFIDEFGNISQPQPYGEFAVINADVSLNDSKTFYIRFGDLISYLSIILAIVSIIYGRIKRRETLMEFNTEDNK